MSGLRDILDAATPGPWRVDDGFGSKIAVYGRLIDGVARTLITEIDTSYDVPFDRDECANDARLIALAPELAALCLDMGAFIRGETPDDECDVPGCTDPWCCDHDADALLARLDAIGEARGPQRREGADVISEFIDETLEPADFAEDGAAE